MSDQLFEVLAGLLDPGSQKDSLLDPVRRLEKVIHLEPKGHVTVWVVDPEVLCVVDYTSSARLNGEE